MTDEERDRIRKAQEFEQSLAEAIDRLPTLWRRVYLNNLREGFETEQAMRILLTYIAAQCGGKFVN